MNGENQHIGFLDVVVKTANGALPIEGALVNIYEYTETSEGSERGGLIYTLETDKNGKAPRVALPAKDKNLSLSYGNPKPFATYNISVLKDGYYDNHYVNAPIFQGVVSMQPVTLIPLAEYASPQDDYPDASRRYVEAPDTDL